MGDKFTNSITPLTFTLNKIGQRNRERREATSFGKNTCTLIYEKGVYKLNSLQANEWKWEMGFGWDELQGLRTRVFIANQMKSIPHIYSNLA